MPAVAPLLRAVTDRCEMDRVALPAGVRPYRLRAGALATPRAAGRRYRSFEERHVSREALRAMQEDGTLPVVVEADFDHFIAARRDLLAARLAAVHRKARGGLLPQVTLGNLFSGREASAAAMVWSRSRAA